MYQHGVEHARHMVKDNYSPLSSHEQSLCEQCGELAYTIMINNQDRSAGKHCEKCTIEKEYELWETKINLI